MKIMKLLILVIIILLASYVQLYQIYCAPISLIQDPPCYFNPLCTCSKPLPDLGYVQCFGVQMPTVPPQINQSVIYILSLKRNGLRFVEERSFFGTGMWRLEINENLISSLHERALYGLERTLRELDLEDNHLSHVPLGALRKLTKLKKLNLNHNLITDLRGERKDFFSPKIGETLKFLSLAYNSISYVDQYSIKNLGFLEHLDLSGNSIHMIHETAFAEDIIRVAASSSSLTSQSLSSSFQRSSSSTHSNGFNTKQLGLVTLNLSGNRLSNIPFESIKNLTNLNVLDISNNLITSTFNVFFKGPKINLDVLNLSGNLITDLPNLAFLNFAKINQTILSWNPINTISEEAFIGIKINNLVLRGCEIKNISTLAWLGLENELEKLDLSLNSLLPSGSSTSPSSMSESIIFFNDSFNDLENLKSFQMIENTEKIRLTPLSFAASQFVIQELMLQSSTLRVPFNPVKYEIHFPNIRKLGLRRLKLPKPRTLKRQDLEGYGGHNLEHLDLSDAYIEEVHYDSFESTPSLKLLNLSSNSISRLYGDPFKVLSRSLQIMDLSSAFSSSYRYVPCDQLESLSMLISLNLMDNDFQGFSSLFDCFGSLKKLRFLSLDFNAITVIPDALHSASSLMHFLMSYNKLNRINSESFNDMVNLIYVDLSYNQIKYIKSMAFSNLKSLLTINMEGNEIEIIENEAFLNIPQLQQLNLSGNRIKQFSFHSFDQIGTLSSFHLDATHNLIDLQTDHSSNRQPDWLPLNSFEVCDFSNNNITYINNSYFISVQNSLTQLILSYNLIHNLTSSTVSNLFHLQRLQLDHNRINFIYSGKNKPFSFLINKVVVRGSNTKVLILNPVKYF